MNSIHRERLPTTEEQLRLDLAEWREITQAFSTTEGVPAPFPKYDMLYSLEDNFVVEPATVEIPPDSGVVTLSFVPPAGIESPALTIVSPGDVGNVLTSTGSTWVSSIPTNSSLTGDVTSVGNVTTVVTNANLTGDVTSIGNTTTVVTNANLTGGVTSIGNATTVVTNANLTGDVTSVGNVTTVGKINGTTLSGLTTGLLKNTTSTGVPSIAVAGTDYIAPAGDLGTPSSGTLSSCTVDGTNLVGFRNIPINTQITAYTAVLADAGKAIYHPATDASVRTYTIPSNALVAYPIGTAITFINMSASNVNIAITTDTMYLSGAGTTGSRVLALYGSATAIKMTSTTWMISGTNLT